MFIHLTIFKYLNKKFKNPDLSVKYVSLIHSILSSLGGLLYFSNMINFKTNYIFVSYSLDYIISDLTLYSLYKELYYERNITYFHHSLFLIGIYLYPKNPNLYNRLIITEISTIPLNLRWIAKFNKNFKKKELYSTLFYISFFLFRIVNCTHMFINMENNYKMYLLGIFLILNYYWFYLINLKLKRIYFK